MNVVLINAYDLKYCNGAEDKGSYDVVLLDNSFSVKQIMSEQPVDPISLVINVLQTGGFRRTIEAFLTECQEKYADGTAPSGSFPSPVSAAPQQQPKQQDGVTAEEDPHGLDRSFPAPLFTCARTFEYLRCPIICHAAFAFGALSIT